MKITTAKVYFACFVAMVFNATVSPTIAILIREGVQPTVIAFYRLLFLSILLVPMVVFKKEHREQYKKLSKKEWGCLIGYSFCQTAGLLLWTEAINAGGTSFLVTIMGNVSIFFVIIMSWIFLKEKTSPRSLLFIIICLGGVGVVAVNSMGQGFGGALPVIISVVGSITGAAYNIFGRFVRRNMSLLPMIAFGYLVSCILTGGIGLLRDCNFVLSLRHVVILVVLGCVCTLVSHSTPIWALRYITPTTASTINLAGPFVVAIVAYFMISEVPSSSMFGGAAVMVVGLYMYIRNERREAIAVKTGLGK